MNDTLRLLRCVHHDNQYCWHDEYNHSPVQIICGTRYQCHACKTPVMSFCSRCPTTKCLEHDLTFTINQGTRWVELKSSAKHSVSSDHAISESEEVVCCPLPSRIENCRAVNRAFIEEAMTLKLSQMGI